MRFSLRQLEYFVATCDAGSVTEAALRIPVSQSSVSSAITQLEAALDVQLLVRHHAQGVSPTPAGRRFLARARDLLRGADELERFASELTHALSGLLELGCLVTLAPLVAPQLCHEFTAKHPAVRIELVEAGQQDLLARLRGGEISLALTYDLDLVDDIAFEPLVALPPYVQFGERHPFAQRESVRLEELVDQPLLLLDLPHSRDYFHGLFAARGLAPTVGRRSSQPEVLRTLAANGYGYSIINARPRTDRSLDGARLRTVRIDGDPRSMVMGVATLACARPSRIVEAYREHCRTRITDTTVPGLRMGDA